MTSPAPILAQWAPSMIPVDRGDLIGYLCAQNATSSCFPRTESDSATHLAIGLRARVFYSGGSQDILANPQEILWLLENLQDCYPGGWDLTMTSSDKINLLNTYLGQQPNFCE